MMTVHHTIFATTLAFGALLAGAVSAHPHGDTEPTTPHNHNNGWVHENGIGPDPDNDSNPATDTGGISLVGDAADAANDPPYSVITFEAPPGRHGDKIGNRYEDEFGIKFSDGLTRQTCEGQRHFYYDSMCTYEAAPSGRFAAGYLNHLNSPLYLTFDKPVCVATMAIYPTGGKQGEPFELTINGWTKNGTALPKVIVNFEWTKDTVRWRHMAGAYYLDEPAAKISISMKSKDAKERAKVLRFLIDDVGYVDENCEEVMREMTKDTSAAQSAAPTTTTAAPIAAPIAPGTSP